MKKIGLIIDTETANRLDDPLVYDFGGAVVDNYGNILHTFRFLIYDTFIVEKELMRSDYYAKKLPDYWKQVKRRELKIITIMQAKKYVSDICKRYGVKYVAAYNSYFDYRALNTTLRLATCSKWRYFLPYGIEIWDILKMVKSTIAQQRKYKNFCEAHGFTYGEKTTRYRITEEIVYQFITQDMTYKEEHTALADVLDEYKIMLACLKTKKKMSKKLFTKCLTKAPQA